MRLEHVHPHHIASIWPSVEKYLAGAMVHSAGEYNLDQLKAMLSMGNQTLLVLVGENGICGAATVATENYPNACIAFVTAIGGRAVAKPEHFALLAEWLKAHGYTAIRGAAFEAVARLWRKQFNAKEIYRVVEIPL